MKDDSKLRAVCTADVVCNPTGIQGSRLFKPLLHKPRYRWNRPLEMEVQTDWICCCWQLTRTSSPFRYIDMHIHSTGKKIISSSTLGHCFCGLGICYFIPTCWHNISSLNRHPAMKSSEEHYCSADCFLALYCAVIVRWIARLAQAHSVCVRNRKGDFFPCFSYQLFLTSPFASYKSEVFVNVILSGNSKGRITDSSPKWNYCFFLPSPCRRRASDATCPRGHWSLQQPAGLAGSWGLQHSSLLVLDVLYQKLTKWT